MLLLAAFAYGKNQTRGPNTRDYDDFPILLASFGLGGAYGLYTFFAAISVLFVVKLVRETKGKPLGGNVSVINKWK